MRYKITAIITFIIGIVSTLLTGAFGLMLLDGEIEMFTVSMLIAFAIDAILGFVNAAQNYAELVSNSVFKVFIDEDDCE